MAAARGLLPAAGIAAAPSPDPKRGAASRGAALRGAAGVETLLAHAAPERTLLAPSQVRNLKAGVAVATTVLLLWGALRQPARPGRAGQRHSRAFDVSLAALGLLGGLRWWTLFQFHDPGFNHPRDDFHYYLGSKYFPELG